MPYSSTKVFSIQFLFQLQGLIIMVDDNVSGKPIGHQFVPPSQTGDESPLFRVLEGRREGENVSKIDSASIFLRNLNCICCLWFYYI